MMKARNDGILKKITAIIRGHPVDASALLVASVALVFSVISLGHESQRHSDTLTSEVIRNAYTDFLALNDLRAEYPLQSHIFETPRNYERNKRLVISAAGKTLNAEELAKLQLQECALAERIFTMFEHSYYQWTHAVETADKKRASFMREVLNYFASRVLPNPRLRWYWSRDGGNLEEHFETNTIAFYHSNVIRFSSDVDPVGPFGRGEADTTAHAR